MKPPPVPKGYRKESLDIRDEYLAPEDDPDSIPLPSGSYLSRADLLKWNGKGCHTCGETIFNIFESGRGVSCPKCVRTPKDPLTREPLPIYGKFDMVKMEVVQVFRTRGNDGTEQATGS
jgi:hypothetical protein